MIGIVIVLKYICIIIFTLSQNLHAWDTSMPGGLKIGINGKIYSFTTDVCSGGVFFKRPVHTEFVCAHGYFFRRPNGCLMTDSDIIAGRHYVCKNQTIDLNSSMHKGNDLVQAFIPLTTPELPLEHTIAFYDDADTLRNFRRYSFLKGLHHMYDPHDPGSPGVVISNTHNTPEINIGKLCYQGIPATGGAAFVANLSFDFSGGSDGFFSRPCKKTSFYFPWRKTIRYDFTQGFSDPHQFAREIQAVPGGETVTESTTCELTTEVPTTTELQTTTTEILSTTTETYLDFLSIEEDVTITTESYGYDNNEDYALETTEGIEITTTTLPHITYYETTEDYLEALTTTKNVNESLTIDGYMSNGGDMDEPMSNKTEDIIQNIVEQKEPGLKDQKEHTHNKQSANLSEIKSIIEQVSTSVDQHYSDKEKDEEKEGAKFIENFLQRLSNVSANSGEHPEIISNLTDQENKRNWELYTYINPNKNNNVTDDFDEVADLQTESTTLLLNLSKPQNNIIDDKIYLTMPVSNVSREINTTEKESSEKDSGLASDSGEEKDQTDNETTPTITDISSTTESATSTNKPVNIIDSSSDEILLDFPGNKSESTNMNEINRHSPVRLKFGYIINPDLTNWDPYVEEAVFLAKAMLQRELQPPGCKSPTIMPHAETKWFAILKAIVPIAKALSPEELIPSDFFDYVVDLFGFVFRSIPDDGQYMDDSIFENVMMVFSECIQATQGFSVHVTGCPKKFNKLDVHKADGSKTHLRLHKLPPKTSAFRSRHTDVIVESVWTIVDIALCNCYASFLFDNANEYYRLYSYMKQVFLNERVQKRWYVAFKDVDAYSGLLPFGDYKTLMYNLDKVKAASHTQCIGAEWQPRPEVIVPDYSHRNIFRTRMSNTNGGPGEKSKAYDSIKPGDNPDSFIIGNEEVKYVRPFQSRPNTKIGTMWRVKRESIDREINILDFIRSQQDPLRNGGAIRSLMDNDSGVEINNQIENTLSATNDNIGNELEKPGFKASQLEIWDGMAYCLQANYEELPDGKLRMRGITPSVESLLEYCDEKALTTGFLHQKTYPDPYEKKGHRVIIK